MLNFSVFHKVQDQTKINTDFSLYSNLSKLFGKL